MRIVRNGWRLATLVGALALAGCGSDSGGDGGVGKEDCDYDTLKKGCVGILNFRSTAQTFAGVSIPPRFPSNGGIAPGLKTVMLSDTSLNSNHDFQGTIGGQTVNVKCTVTDFTWLDVNPAVIIQQEALGALVNCSNW